jgi:hypothetical protein
MLATLRQSEPAAYAELSELARTGDIIEIMGQAIAPYGLATDNLADAYAFWWIHAWLAWAGDTSDQTPAQVRAVAGQAAAAILAAPALAQMDDAARQEMAEALLLQGALIGSGIEQMKSDASVKPHWRAAMEQSGQTMGLDFSAMRLTAQGFVPAQASPATAQTTRTAGAPSPAASPAHGVIDSALSDRLIDRVIFSMWGDMQFHPTALLRDGTAFEIDHASLEAEPPERSRRLHPRAWGRWAGSGDSLTLIASDGDRSVRTIGEGVYRSFPGRPGQTLQGTYSSASGMQVGEVSMLNSGRITFFPDGRFASRRDFAATGSGEYSGTSMAGGGGSAADGTYAISGHRIVLHHSDGRVEDMFFGFGGKGRPQRQDTEMIFLGDTAWVRDD